MLLEIAPLAERLGALVAFERPLLFVYRADMLAEIGSLCEIVAADVAGVAKDPLFGNA